MADLDLANLRRQYAQGALEEGSAPSDPFILLRRWLEEAVAAQMIEPNAFLLATVDKEGQPHARVLLLKGFEPPFLYFYTNYESAKAQEMADNSRVAATFWWDVLERQVRIEGRVEKAPTDISDAYFASRPYESQIGAWASPQSQPINKETLTRRWEEYARRYPEKPVPRPPYWGGYRLLPHRIEFWQGRPSRLHDRLVYIRRGEIWEKLRLAP
ncbi:MAG: pyridoxamine 5'-phosphate oxidase [Bacteroidia bacterium]|nr:pyridoxamine 5'-phosphate oxidase [Bacteroidia bacterium]MCX7651329.1 pyridoxamine 5'-phosphate oxidase [Bacteroidia bacterium]MDW8417151.1 pyridoxamine 5'-phosphate oxidase [Bacteroidia bacterium]